MGVACIGSWTVGKVWVWLVQVGRYGGGLYRWEGMGVACIGGEVWVWLVWAGGQVGRYGCGFYMLGVGFVSLTSLCCVLQLSAQVLEKKDIGFGILDPKSNAKIAKKLGRYLHGGGTGCQPFQATSLDITHHVSIVLHV